MLSSPNLQSPLILTHVSKSSVMTSSRRPSPPTTHMHTCTYTHTHTHMNAHTYTHTFQPGIGCCPSAHIVTIMSYSTNISFLHYTVCFWNASTIFYSSGPPQSLAQCLVGRMWVINAWWSHTWTNPLWYYRDNWEVFGKGIYWLKNKPWGQCTSLKGQQLKLLVIFFCDKYW